MDHLSREAKGVDYLVLCEWLQKLFWFFNVSGGAPRVSVSVCDVLDQQGALHAFLVPSVTGLITFLPVCAWQSTKGHRTNLIHHQALDLSLL